MNNGGPVDSCVGAFIFKNDGKSAGVYMDADGELAYADEEGKPAKRRVEVHTTKATPTGLAATTARDGEQITWADLNAALPRGVGTLWLVGCETKAVLDAWKKPADGPARASMLVTTASLDWQELVAFFRAEATLSGFVFSDKMVSYLTRKLPSLGPNVKYFDARTPEWAEFKKAEYVDRSELPSPTKDELNGLWPGIEVEPYTGEDD